MHDCAQEAPGPLLTGNDSRSTTYGNSDPVIAVLDKAKAKQAIMETG